jgi:putative flippase GtrA
MKAKLRSVLQGPFGRYLIVGVSVYIFEIIIIVIAQKMGANAIVAVAIAFWLGLVTSFLLQKIFTFRDKRMHHKVLLPQVIAVTLLVLFNFGFTLLMTKLLSHLLPATIVRTLALGITTIWNFYLYKMRIFKSSEELVY